MGRIHDHAEESLIDSQRASPGSARVVNALASWGLPLLVGAFYFAAYYPGFTNHDSQSIWLNAFALVQDPPAAPYGSWYSPLLILVRVAALESGLGVAGYHALFCALTYGTWAVLVATLLRRPVHRAFAHLLLLLPFIGANLAFQVPDAWVAVGLSWMVIALARGSEGCNRWGAAALYFAGALLALGARQNTLIALPVLMAVPLLLGPLAPTRVRYLCAAAPLAALLVARLAIAALPVHDEYKAETYMAFETIGVWKSVVSEHPDAEKEGVRRPALFDALPRPAAFYLDRWDPADVDAIIWELPEFEDREDVIGPNAKSIQSDYFRVIREHPLHFARMKLRFALNGLGLTRPDALAVSEPPDNAFINQLGIPLHHRPLASWFTIPLLESLYRTQPAWAWMSSPLGWWSLCGALILWPRARRQVTRLDAAWLMLAAGYYATILLFAPLYLPRYAFPVWIVLGAGMMRLLLEPGRQRGAKITETPTA